MNSVDADDWAAELAIIASNVDLKQIFTHGQNISRSMALIVNYIVRNGLKSREGPHGS